MTITSGGTIQLLGGVFSIGNIVFLMFSVFAVIALGYMLGRINIKGVALGDAGVFIMALVFGCFFYGILSDIFKGQEKNLLKAIENLGLILFVTSVGFVAGPKFFGNLKKNFKSYVLMGIVIILAGGLSAYLCIFVGNNFIDGIKGKELTSMVVGLLSGSLTSTPAFSAAKQTVASVAGENIQLAEEFENLVTVGHGISYIFGVIGVVLFVQIVPKMLKADMAHERMLLTASDTAEVKKDLSRLLCIDHLGFGAFALAAVVGSIVGNIKVPLTTQGLSGTTFSLTVTGGCLLAGLVFGHFGKIGRISVMPDNKTLTVFKELGLILFLVGAGIAGGAQFVKYFDAIYFVYGIIMTMLPMLIGFFFAKYVLKLSLLNNLGSLTGGMTSTPALGTLIDVAGTEDVAAAYAATYPVALVAVVLVSQFIIILF